MSEDRESERLQLVFENLIAGLETNRVGEIAATKLADLVKVSTLPATQTSGSSSRSTAGEISESGVSARSNAARLFSAFSSVVPTSALSGASVATASVGTQDSGLAGIWKVLGSGLGLIPAVAAIARLFGGGGAEPLPELIKYEAPRAVRIEASGRVAGRDRVDLSDVTYNERGLPRQNTLSAGNANITLQIQALDSRSILDRSHDIARAVREAMLHMDPINDVVNDI